MAKGVIVAIWLSLLMVSLSVVSADGPGRSEDGAVPEPGRAPAATSLWRVKTDSSVVYLMGSIHLLREEDYPLHPAMEKAFEDAKTLVFEAEIDSVSTPAFQQYVFFKALYDSGKTLQAELGDSVYKLLDAAMEPMGLDIAQMNQFEPWMVALTFELLKFQQMGFDPGSGVDIYFYKRAKAAGKTIAAFETPEYQIDLFDSMSAKDQRTLILQTLEQTADFERMQADIVRYWKTGDLDGLEATINKSLADFPGIREWMLSSRNRDWMAKIETYINSRGRHLIIVGVGHMSGEAGLIALLRKAGYRVEQM
jgi:uncharacterized protein YbaP (TraB family)